MQVIGFCRFSYPAQGGFQVEHETTEGRAAYLYEAGRMEDRFRQFECICLPSIRAQTDPDFTFVILVGDSLPPAYLDRLQALIADVPQARIVARPPGPHRKVCAEVINAARVSGTPCLQFRHDDDDAVSLDFVERLRSAAADAPGLFAREGAIAVDFNRGYVVEPGPKGIRAQETVTPYWGVALAMYAAAGTRNTIMNFAHNKMNRFMPTLSFTDSPMYLRGHNPHNDSRQGKHVTQPDLHWLTPDKEAAFCLRFGVDCDFIRARFGA